MKKNTMTVFLAAGLLPVILSGCQNKAGQGDVISPYQFIKEYGIKKSEYPIYMLDPGTEQEVTQGDVTLHSIFAIQQNQELIVSAVLDDRSDIPEIDAKEAAQARRYHELSDGTKISSARYQEVLWDSGEGMVLTGPGLPEEGCRPDDTQNRKASYVASYDFYEAYGYMRYFLEARFQIPAAVDFESYPDGYSVRVLDLDRPVRLSMVRAPGYATLEELAKGGGGDIDTHGDFSVIAIGEKSEEGVIVSLYVCSNAGDQAASVIHIPPQQYDKIDLPALSDGERNYPIRRQVQANPLIDRMGLYRLEGENQDGNCRRYLFEVPLKEQNGSFSLTIPGLTLPSAEVSEPVTLPIPDESKMLAEEIPFQNGTVRLLKITRMEEPAVYIDIEADSDMGEAALRGLLCQRKRDGADGWEYQRYDFDENGNLDGFEIVHDEDDTEVTVRFLSPAIYWKQPFEMELPLAN